MNIDFKLEIDLISLLNSKLIKRLVKIINIFLIRFFKFLSPHYLIGILRKKVIFLIFQN